MASQLSLVITRLVIYLLLFNLLIIPCIFIFDHTILFYNDAESSRYMLSALVQTEAAIIAIVITLSLVAVQLAASSYSARIIKVFRTNPDLWILIGIYGIAIFFGLSVLKLINNLNIYDIVKFVNFAFYLGFYAYLSLIIYIWNLLDLLKPSKIIKKLCGNITKNNILLAIEDKKIIEIDPIQPIIDIIVNSLMKYDIETVRNGLTAIGDRTKFILENEELELEEEVKISAFIIESHLIGIGKIAASRKDAASTLKVITTLRKIGMVTVEQKYYTIMRKVAESFTKIGIITIEEKLEDTTNEAINSLEEIGKAALEQNPSGSIPILFSLYAVGKAAIDQNLENTAFRSANSIHEIGKLVPNTIRNEIQLRPIPEFNDDNGEIYSIVVNNEYNFLSGLQKAANEKNLSRLENDISDLLESYNTDNN